jgi:glycosyltransferase involved in cell wall biosynthesis
LSIGVVVIGRNEGERLSDCLQSLGGNAPVVYVDSGSTDGSEPRA